MKRWNNHLSRLLLLAVLIWSWQATSAATIDIGTLSPSNPYINPLAQAPGSFSDTYNFTLGSDGHAIINATAIDLAPIYAINGLSLSLFDAPDASGATLATGSTIQWLLPAGDHSFRISGLATGTAGGFYTAAIAVSAVPLPAAFWLMLSAMGLAGLMLRRSGNAAVRSPATA